MTKHRPLSPRVVVLAACLLLLPAGLRSGADEKPTAASQVAAAWTHPDAKANSGATGSGDSAVAGVTFRVPRPFEEVWQFYAKKCGYTSPFPDTNMTLAMSGSKSCAMMYENSKVTGGGISSAFAYRENGATINVSLVDRKDGVRVFVLVGAR